MGVRVHGNVLKIEISYQTVATDELEKDPRPRCREICNIRECDPQRNEFVCNYFGFRLWPKGPRPERRVGLHQLRRTRLNRYDDYVMRVIEEFRRD